MIPTPVSLHAAGLKVFPCSAKKRPTEKGWQRPQPPEFYHWPTEFIVLPTPPGVMIIDLDTYKGVTRQAVENLLGCSLPWDLAFIQTTQSGGEHYAFRVEWPARQGANIENLQGFDTRGEDARGYIVTGPGYLPQGSAGVYRLGQPASLPLMPDAARHILERKAVQVQHIELPQDSQDVDKMRSALHHIDPSDRDTWFKVGCGIAFEFHDQPDIGFALFDEWASGEYWPEGCPMGYSPDTQEHQFMSMSPTMSGDRPLITPGTLYKLAKNSGWAPPAIDTSAAFGPQFAEAETYYPLVDRIYEHGSDPKVVLDIVDDINGANLSPKQRGLLRGLVHRALKESGLPKDSIEEIIGKVSDDRPGKLLPPMANPGQLIPCSVPLHPDSWAKFHTKGRDNSPLGTRENFDILLAAYGLRIQYNMIGKSLEITGPGVQTTGDMKDNAALAFIGSQVELNGFPHGRVSDCIAAMANANRYNPVVEWINSTLWDGRDHVGLLFNQMTLNPEEDPNTAAMLFRKWFRGAVAIGCEITNKMEYVLTLVDPMGGKGKTRFFNTFCPADLQKDGVTLDPANTDSHKIAVSYWLVELGELDATFNKADQARLKAHLSSGFDELRMPYAKTSDKYARRTAYFGSVNKDEFLVDDSGNRRFWPIRVTDVNYEHTVDVQQVWAQALAEVQSGQSWHLTPEENTFISARNNEFRETHPVEEKLADRFDISQPEPLSHLTATKCLEACGVFSPKRAEQTAAAAWLRRNKFRETKNDGRKGFWVPQPTSPTAPAFGPQLATENGVKKL